MLTSLHHAKAVTEAWRREYNEERPEKGFGGLTPSAYAKKLASKVGIVSSGATEERVTSSKVIKNRL